MSKIFTIVGVSLLVFFVFSCGELQDKWTLASPDISIEDLQTSDVQRIENQEKARSLGAMADFRQPAKKVMPGVVHVISSYKKLDAPQQQFEVPNLFKDFFGDDFWFDFRNPDSRSMPRQGSGSGVLISPEGHIVTNNHVVAGADQIEVVLNDNRSYPAKVMGTDPATDLALLKIEEEELPFVVLGNSDKLEIGEWVLAVGNPFNLSTTVTAGIVSAKARNINIIQDQASIESFIQTDAAVNPGNSGGALVNLDGLLVGINTAIASPTGAYAGYSFAVPINIAKKVVDDILNYGQVQRAYLGVFIRGLDGALAEKLDLESTKGVYIDSLMPGGSAEMAGLLPGDVIIDIDGVEISSVPQLQEIIGTHRPGDDIQILVIAKGKKRALTIELKGKRGENKVAKKDKSKLLEELGIEVEDLMEKELPKLNKGLAGIKVTKIYPGIVRTNTTMRAGFVITKIDREVVSSVKQFLAIIERHEGGVMLEGYYPENPEKMIYYAFGISG